VFKSLIQPGMPVSEYTNEQTETPENRVIRQLVEALLFEQICPYDYQNGYFYFNLNQTDYKTKGKITGFSRIRLESKHLYTRRGNNWHHIHLAELVDNLPASQKVKNRLISELKQTVSLCRWNHQYLTRLNSRRELSYVELESAIDEGHPYHPCFKARTGFNTNDHQKYGPEAANCFQLHWLAVRRCYLKRSFASSSDHAFWQQELEQNSFVQLHTVLAKQTHEPSAFALLPVHPWQWLNIKPKLAAAIQNQQVFYLGAAGDYYQASISVRTLLNVIHPGKANIKLPLNMVNTSSLRTIENHSICTAPALSNWLETLWQSDPFLQEYMILLPEYAGISLANDGNEFQPWVDELADQLGVIFRQSIHRHTDKCTLPFVALTAIEQDKKPFIDPWIQSYGCQKWLKHLIKISVIPIWHLLVKHGIALEAHAQNLLIEHQQGWPQKVILRDFHESLEYVPDFLAEPDLAPVFSELNTCYQSAKPDQYYWMSSVEALRELFVDTLFVFNLADLAVLLEMHYQFPEQQFWQLIFQAFQDYQRAGLTGTARLQKINIFKSDIQTESLLKKKFSEKSSAEFHHAIQNPLADKNRQSQILNRLFSAELNSESS